MIGPISAGMPISAMALISSDFGTERTRMSRPTGTIMAPPNPWQMRAMMSWLKSCEKPQAIDDRVKIAIASRKMLRAPKRSATQPLMGRKAASDSI